MLPWWADSGHLVSDSSGKRVTVDLLLSLTAEPQDPGSRGREPSTHTLHILLGPTWTSVLPSGALSWFPDQKYLLELKSYLTMRGWWRVGCKAP